MALLAVVGVVAVYRLQQVSAEINQVVTRILHRLEFHVNTNRLNTAKRVLEEEVKNHRDSLRAIMYKYSESQFQHREAKQLIEDPELNRLYDAHNDLSGHCDRVKAAMRLPVIDGVVVIIGSLLLLPLASLLHNALGPTLEGLIFCTLIALNLRFLIRLWRFSTKWL